MNENGKSAKCVYGITSYGSAQSPCGDGQPTVYASVAYYVGKLQKGDDSEHVLIERGDSINFTPSTIPSNSLTVLFYIVLFRAWLEAQNLGRNKNRM